GVQAQGVRSLLRGVDLVRDEYGGLAASPKQVYRLPVCSSRIRAAIEDTEDDVGLFDSRAHVSGDPLSHRVCGVRIEAASVDEGDLAPVQESVGVVTIPRYTGCIMDDGPLTPD